MDSEYRNAQANYVPVLIRSDVLESVQQSLSVVDQALLGEPPFRAVQPEVVISGRRCGSCGADCEELAIDTLTMPARVQCFDCCQYR